MTEEKKEGTKGMIEEAENAAKIRQSWCVVVQLFEYIISPNPSHVPVLKILQLRG